MKKDKKQSREKNCGSRTSKEKNYGSKNSREKECNQLQKKPLNNERLFLLKPHKNILIQQNNH